MRSGATPYVEVQAAFAELNVAASTEEALSFPGTDAVFDELLEPLNPAAYCTQQPVVL